MKRTVVFDFDGVIHSYTSGWKGTTVIPDEPVKGIRELISKLRESKYEVVVVSTRCKEASGIGAIQSYLAKHDIIVDKVCMEKPPAIVYIDDRAIAFDGETDGLYEKIINFKNWLQSNSDIIVIQEGIRTAFNDKGIGISSIKIKGMVQNKIDKIEVSFENEVEMRVVKDTIEEYCEVNKLTYNRILVEL